MCRMVAIGLYIAMDLRCKETIMHHHPEYKRQMNEQEWQRERPPVRFVKDKKK